MRNTLALEVIGIIVIGTVNSILISMLFAMFWPAAFAERVIAGIVLMPISWIIILLLGLTASNFLLFFKVNCVLTIIFFIPVFWLLII